MSGFTSLKWTQAEEDFSCDVVLKLELQIIYLSLVSFVSQFCLQEKVNYDIVVKKLIFCQILNHFCRLFLFMEIEC